MNAGLSKKELRQIYFRSMTLQASWSYERMQALGFACCISPVLQKVYENDKQGLSDALARHMEFFNTCPNYGAPLILGITAALEETKAPGEMITGLKTSMMGPLAGIGDSMMFAILGPLLFSIPAAMTLANDITGAAIVLAVVEVLFIVFNATLKWKLLNIGYKQGSQLAQGSMDVMEKITFGAGILGLVVVGALISSIVGVATPLQWHFGEFNFVLQDVLDSFFPKLIPAILTGTIFYLIRKKNLSPVKIVILLFISFTIFGALGIFA